MRLGTCQFERAFTFESRQKAADEAKRLAKMWRVPYVSFRYFGQEEYQVVAQARWSEISLDHRFIEEAYLAWGNESQALKRLKNREFARFVVCR